MSKKLLIIDDDTNLLKMLEMYFQKNNFIVSTFNNVEEAFETVKQHKTKEEIVNLFIVDIQMPKFSGFHFVKMLRSIQHYQYVPIIFMTSNLNKLLEKQAYKLNVIDYYIKPFDFEMLAMKIDSLINNLEDQKKANFLISNGPFNGEEIDVVFGQDFMQRFTGILMLESEHAKCKVLIENGIPTEFDYKESNLIIASESEALDRITKWGDARYSAYYPEITNYIDLEV